MEDDDWGRRKGGKTHERESGKAKRFWVFFHVSFLPNVFSPCLNMRTKDIVSPNPGLIYLGLVSWFQIILNHEDQQSQNTFPLLYKFSGLIQKEIVSLRTHVQSPYRWFNKPINQIRQHLNTITDITQTEFLYHYIRDNLVAEQRYNTCSLPILHGRDSLKYNIRDQLLWLPTHLYLKI